MKKCLFVLVLLIGLVLNHTAQAGKIIVANDDWTLSNAGFVSAPDAGTFATNVAAWFTGGGPGTFHAYTNNFGLTESSLANTMAGAGHTWTTGTGITFDLPTLLTYDGIFLGGFFANQLKSDTLAVNPVHNG